MIFYVQGRRSVSHNFPGTSSVYLLAKNCTDPLNDKLGCTRNVDKDRGFYHAKVLWINVYF